MTDEQIIEVAKLAIHEAREDLRMTTPKLALVEPVLALAWKALAGGEITTADLDSVSAQLAHKLRDLLGLQGESS
jgi:hypothetical protein